MPVHLDYPVAVLPKEKLIAIFGKDLMADESLRPIFEELNGTAAVKPFECVGTVEEVRACLAATTKVPEPEVDKQGRSIEGPTITEILNRFNNEHFLPEKFVEILKEVLKSE